MVSSVFVPSYLMAQNVGAAPIAWTGDQTERRLNLTEVKIGRTDVAELAETMDLSKVATVMSTS